MKGFMLAKWITNRLPIPLIREPERFFIAVASILIGIGSFWPVTQPGSLKGVFPSWLILEWGVTLGGGGVAKIIGITMSGQVIVDHKSQKFEASARWFERLGASLIALGAFTYACVALMALGLPGFVIIVFMSAVSIASALRLVVSYVGRSVLGSAKEQDDE